MDSRALPKIDLHRHLEGSVRFGTFLELARDVGGDLPARELRHRTTMAREKPGYQRFLSKFELYRGLYPSRDWIERVAYEAAEDALKDGVIYLELRFSPAHFARRMKASGEDVSAWIAGAARRAGVAVRFVATFGREFSLRENAPTARAVEGTDVFSGLDLAGDESRSASPFLPFFRRTGLPATIHAGEAGGAEHVREAIDRFGAERIGHGLGVLEDPRTVQLARDRRVVFETCPTSEIQTGAARSWKDHPIRRMAEERLRLTVNTDDPSICGVTLSQEYRAALSIGLGEEGLRTALLEAADSSFQEPSERRRLRRRIESAWPGKKS